MRHVYTLPRIRRPLRGGRARDEERVRPRHELLRLRRQPWSLVPAARLRQVLARPHVTRLDVLGAVAEALVDVDRQRSVGLRHHRAVHAVAPTCRKLDAEERDPTPGQRACSYAVTLRRREIELHGSRVRRPQEARSSGEKRRPRGSVVVHRAHHCIAQPLEELPMLFRHEVADHAWPDECSHLPHLRPRLYVGFAVVERLVAHATLGIGTKPGSASKRASHCAMRGYGSSERSPSLARAV